jgi:hypothetical protein
MLRVIALALVVTAAPALAARIAVLPFKGPKSAKVHAQLKKKLCSTHACIAPAKARSASAVDAVVAGVVTQKRGQFPLLELRVYAADDNSLALTRKYPLLVTGAMRPPRLADATKSVSLALRKVGAPPPAVAEDEEEEDEELPSGGKLVSAPAASDAPVEPLASMSDLDDLGTALASATSNTAGALTGAGAGDAGAPSGGGSEAELAREQAAYDRLQATPVNLVSADERTSVAEALIREEAKFVPADEPEKLEPSLLTVQAGTEMLSRDWRYDNLTTNNLRQYRAGTLLSPRLRVELRAPFRLGAFKLGADADFSTTLGSRSRRSAEDATQFPTAVTRFDGGLRIATRPIAASALTVSGTLGFRLASFNVAAAADKTTLDGLPNIAYQAVRAGGAVQVPLYKGLSAYGELAYLAVLSSGQISSNLYFPGATVSGFDGMAGVAYRLSSSWELTLSGQLSQYTFGFSPSPAATYRATGAVDRYLGGALSLRFHL